jgi:methyl-accepting chemotaxis protein
VFDRAIAQAAHKINSIIEAFGGIKEIIGQIAPVSHEQLAANDEVNRSLNEIAQVIDHLTLGTRDSAKPVSNCRVWHRIYRRRFLSFDWCRTEE